MSTKVTTPFGHPVPPAPRHSITVHFSSWNNVESYGSDPAAVITTFKNVYPRMRPHPDIAALAKAVIQCIGFEHHLCFLFSSLQSAHECVAYATSPRLSSSATTDPIEKNLVDIRAFAAKDLFFAVIFPTENLGSVASFWSTPGVGVSSRFAEANLAAIDKLTEVALPATEASRLSFNGTVHAELRKNIVHHIGRASITGDQQKPSTGDVYLFPSGMASIYKPHTYISRAYNGITVLFGMAFMNTPMVFEDYGAGSEFFGLGDEEDLDRLADFLEEKSRQGQKVQAIWAECPANPLLVTPNLERLRALADKYDVLLAIDDTIGSWANIDVIHLSDMVVTSLTKSFNGYADVIAGSVVLNPVSSRYRELKKIFDTEHVPELYEGDAATTVENSGDYLERTAKLNANGHALVQYFEACAKDSQSAVSAVFHPSVNPSGKNYKRYLRRDTPELTPGFGGLLSVEFEDLAATKAFYDNLSVHTGPHLGAPFTLVFAYTMCIYKRKLDWAARYGLKPTQVRIAAGLEDTEELLSGMKAAVKAADETKREKSISAEHA